jgi:hypothetical protein
LPLRPVPRAPATRSVESHHAGAEPCRDPHRLHIRQSPRFSERHAATDPINIS